MIAAFARLALYGAVFFSLFIVDYALGKGLVNMIQKIFCKITCFVKMSIREEEKLAVIAESESPTNIQTLLMELILLSLTIAFLKKYKQRRGTDRIDELLHESKEALRLTDEFLEKWRMRRVPTDTSYLDEEPQELKPFKLEEPILHMAIVDTRGSPRSQSERGDAGDSLNYQDSSVISVISLVGDDDESITEPLSDDTLVDDTNSPLEVQNRYLWDVMEEDPNMEY